MYCAQQVTRYKIDADIAIAIETKITDEEEQGSIMMVFLLLLSVLLQHCNSQNFQCCDGTVRLAGGSLANEGRVEICQSGEWKTVCDNNWSENEARVVCRQLGYSEQGTVVPLLRAEYGQGTGTIVEHIRCSGTETQLTDCNIRDVLDGECTHSDDASVQCTCRSGDLRLRGSTIQGSGRVEVCISNAWGTVCDNSWSSNDARVVCKQLGFSIIGASTASLQAFGQGSGPIHMDNVRCTGTELSLIDCPHNRHHSCSHGDDVAVQCQTGIICHDGDVRLVNGSGPHEGRVEVCFNETWGTICSYIHPWSWNTTQADIVCQQLGYSGADKSTLGFGRGSLPVLVKYVYCRGHESNIGECTYSITRLSDCFHYGGDVIGVHCIDVIKNGELRLVNGLKYSGRVEMYWNSEWKTVCYDGWDEYDAQVVCRQLHHLSTSVQVLATSYEGNHGNLIQLTNVGCDGSENNLTSCCASEISNGLSCHSGTYAGVRCAQCIENDIKLIGELSQSEGYVIICFEGAWGKIGYGNIAAATVVCRQLGFSAENSVAYITSSCFIRFEYEIRQGLPVTLGTVECSSAELQLSHCNHTRSSGHTSYEGDQFGVRCQTLTETVPGAPQAVQISNITSSTISLTWSPPLISERHGLSIFNYVINCSAGPRSLGNNNPVAHTDSQNATIVNLHPFTAYNCCVAVSSSNGRGRLACLRAVTLPSGVPTRLMTFSIDSTSVLVSWHAPDADESCDSSGLLRQYYIEITDDNSGNRSFHIADDTHLLLDSLQPGHQYTFRVAAYTTEKGPFSDPISITLPSLKGLLIAALSSLLGLISIALLIAVIVAISQGYRLFKQPWKKTAKSDQSGSDSVPVQAMPYEVVNMSSIQSSSSNTTATVTSKNLPSTSRGKQLKMKKKAGASHEYLNSPIIDSSQKPTTSDRTGKPAEKDNYQPLIPSKADEKSEYQSLTQKKGPIIPPAVPPKSKTKSIK